MSYLYRTPVLVRRKQPYVDWANSCDDDDAPVLTLELARRESTVYLLPERTSRDSDEEWISAAWEDIFEEELYSWMEEEQDWPANRTREMFDAWFDVDFADTIIDLDPEAPLTEEDVKSEEFLIATETCAWCQAEIEPEKGRYTGFTVASLGVFASRVGLTLAVSLGPGHFAFALLPPPGTPASDDGNIVFRVCSAKCAKLVRRKATAGLRALDLSPVAG